MPVFPGSDNRVLISFKNCFHFLDEYHRLAQKRLQIVITHEDGPAWRLCRQFEGMPQDKKAFASLGAHPNAAPRQKEDQ
jgi:hypothetical protein